MVDWQVIGTTPSRFGWNLTRPQLSSTLSMIWMMSSSILLREAMISMPHGHHLPGKVWKCLLITDFKMMMSQHLLVYSKYWLLSSSQAQDYLQVWLSILKATQCHFYIISYARMFIMRIISLVGKRLAVHLLGIHQVGAQVLPAWLDLDR